jgi:molybdopterin/thiamine biosynthesis adenylyltransferase
MITRNLGGQFSLEGKRVLLVGCGTIGSHLARFLVQGGAGQERLGCLSLVDHQVLKPGNIGRHLLSAAHLQRPKAEALAEELSEQFPGTKIVGVSSPIMERRDLVAVADLVIDATGEEAVSFALNDLLVRLRPNAPDALYVWLYGNGAAAQCLFVNGKKLNSVCRKCLHPELSGVPRYYPIAAGWDAREIPAACGEAAFLPYGVAASAIAAGLASKMVMDWVDGRMSSALRTLRIDAVAAVDTPDCTPDREVNCPCCNVQVALILAETQG